MKSMQETTTLRAPNSSTFSLESPRQTVDNTLKMTDSPTGPRQLLSIILPAYNEQEVLPLTHSRFSGIVPTLNSLGLDLELIFVNDGSKDSTPAMLDELADKDSNVRVVHLTRNFGHQAAITA